MLNIVDLEINKIKNDIVINNQIRHKIKILDLFKVINTNTHYYTSMQNINNNLTSLKRLSSLSNTSSITSHTQVNEIEELTNEYLKLDTKLLKMKNKSLLRTILNI